MKFNKGDVVLVGKPQSDQFGEAETYVQCGAIGQITGLINDGNQCEVKFSDEDHLVRDICDHCWFVYEDRLSLVAKNHSPGVGNMVRPSPAEDGSTTERLVDQIRSRHHAGLKKYGVTVDRNDLESLQWVQHFREELLDALAYLQRIEDKLNNK